MKKSRKEFFITEQLKKAEYNHELTEKMKEKLIDLLFKFENAFATDTKPLGAIIGQLSEGWLIIYIDDIIVFLETWDSHLTRLEKVLQKIVQVNMRIVLKKCHFAYSELKALGHVVSGLRLGLDKKNVEAVLLKPIPKTKEQIQ
ncbi:hypothetical protein O181_074074 [Austropuccinia psidii MF-1]|uniref:Reverse transcriptase domain-containing protein n=1 Tax=Austropuccinia psidii MF-1 TaxID=1389203 RepID=A0A9Q3F7Y4_9BASI|nr:hypothetical protein [Austropuccinia psidii MF-1]